MMSRHVIADSQQRGENVRMTETSVGRSGTPRGDRYAKLDDAFQNRGVVFERCRCLLAASQVTDGRSRTSAVQQLGQWPVKTRGKIMPRRKWMPVAGVPQAVGASHKSAKAVIAGDEGSARTALVADISVLPAAPFYEMTVTRVDVGAQYGRRSQERCLDQGEATADRHYLRKE